MGGTVAVTTAVTVTTALGNMKHVCAAETESGLVGLEMEQLLMAADQVTSASSSVVKNKGSLLFAVGSGCAAWIAETAVRCWFVLALSILIEIYATAMTKVASDSQNLVKLVYALSLYVISLLGFAACLAKIDVSIAYAVWSALGTAVVSIIGIVYFGERCDTSKLVSLSLIILGVIGLNLQEEH
eukprot:CAMPEP_0198293914 /NCGR_PEP_ID=MMETSP1449-20131203/19548_1 /TAXON_ID=420275 /ORGANISM="Attheya septentrionalis, Strain CCMP2084" /LENGTH=184 /DNA_ID=CAMNT_0043993673 /DNA_START=264 /DNA_END=818 /DNA_ORIENTATION=+